MAGDMTEPHEMGGMEKDTSMDDAKMLMGVDAMKKDKMRYDKAMKRMMEMMKSMSSTPAQPAGGNQNWLGGMAQ